MIVLDANVLIAHLSLADAHHHRADTLLRTLAVDEFAVSPLTKAEILVGPARSGLVAHTEATLRELGVRVIWLGSSAPARLATLRATTALKLPDCCVLLAAEQEGAAIATFDQRLATVARDLGLVVHS